MDSQKELPKGYMGRILEIDLGKKQFRYIDMEPDLALRFFGGRGIGAALLFRHFEELHTQGDYKDPFMEVEGLSPDNVVIIATSPATGTRMPASGRFHMNFKSPLSEGLGSSDSGGFWGVQLKHAGVDVLRIVGRAETPTYLVLDKDGVTFHDAAPLAGLSTEKTSELLLQELPKGSRVLSIGEAGKQMVRFAGVISERGRALGRSGGGAVWGSKNLHAVAVVPDPSIKIETADPEMLDIKNRESATFKAKMMLDVGKLTRKESHYGILSSLGSLGLLGMVNNHGQLSHNNMQNNAHDKDNIAKVNGEALRNHKDIAAPGTPTVEVKKGTCFNCPVACKRETTVLDEKGEYVDSGEGPEFETVTLMGANLSIYDLPLITKANYAANRFGMDTVSLGSTIASFFELYTYCRDKQNLSEQERSFMEEVRPFVNEVGEPVFGNSEVLLPLVDMIGNRRGIGFYLGEGSYRFCSRYGHPEFSMTVKQQELPAYDPRGSFSQGLSYEMSNRGGCHLEGGYMAAQAYAGGYGEWPADRTEGTPLILKNASLRNTIYDVIGSCVYTSFSIGLDDYAKLLNAITGLNLNAGELQRLGHRVFTLERLFNVRCGKGPQDDWLPRRFFTDPITVDGGERVCDEEAFRRMHGEYYDAMGWDAEGVPTEEVLHKLKLGDFISFLTEKRS